MTDLNRRTFVKGVGAAGAASMLPGQAAGLSTATVDERFDADGGLQESLVVFDGIESAAGLDALDLERGYHLFENLAIAHTFLTPAQVETVAGWDTVLRVKRSERLEYLNDPISRDSMEVPEAHGHDAETGYQGEGTHIVVIDSGLDGSHPGFQGRIEANYRYVDDPMGERDTLWVDVGETPNDEVGHGTHCMGIAGGDGSGAVAGDYHGMAPETTITAYNTTQAVYLPYAVAAWDHLLGRIQEPDNGFDPDVVTNSYGVARGTEYNPFDPVNVATWRVYQEGLFIAFAAGNDGKLGTGNRFAKAPHVMSVAAAEKTIDEEKPANNRPITGFSSRGRAFDPEKAEKEPSKYIADRTFYDRETLLANLTEYWDTATGRTRPVGSDTRTGRIGPAVNSSPGAALVDEETRAATAYETFDAAGNADITTLDLSFRPEGQWVRVRVYERRGEEYRQVASNREEPVKLHTDLTFDVTGGREYLVEFEAEDAAYAEYEVTIEQSARLDGDLSDIRPITMFRPSVATHGNSVMSTVQAGSVLGPVAAGLDSANEVMYGRLSGTSMATPACAGIGALCIQAYRENHPDGERPDPADVIRIIESTARSLNPGYAAHDAGAGYIDAEAAVETAERLARGEVSVADLETGLDAVV